MFNSTKTRAITLFSYCRNRNSFYPTSIISKGYFLIKGRKSKEKLEPELRIYNQPNIITSEADIKTTFLSDKFITMNTVQNEEYFNIRYLVKPFMLWIWISVLLISLGGTISLLKRKSL